MGGCLNAFRQTKHAKCRLYGPENAYRHMEHQLWPDDPHFASAGFSSALVASAAAGFASAGAGNTSILLATFHSLSESLWLPVASIVPSGLNATAHTVLL